MTEPTDSELLDTFKEMAAPEYDLYYSVLRGKLDWDEARFILKALQIAISHLQEKLGGTPK